MPSLSIEGQGMELIEEQTASLISMDRTQCEIDLRALVHANSPLLFRVAQAILRNSAEAEDAVQDAFVRVLQHRSTLPEVRDMRVWLVRIVCNLALDRRRRGRTDQLDQAVADALAADQVPAEQALVEAQRLRAVFLKIDKLPSIERQALILSAVDDLSPTEIAAVLERSEAAVRGLLFRTRKRLRPARTSPRPAVGPNKAILSMPS